MPLKSGPMIGSRQPLFGSNLRLSRDSLGFIKEFGHARTRVIVHRPEGFI